jgi:large subunit ribosomal protein L25
MDRPTLSASLRENTGKGYNRRLRAAGEIPGVVYGLGKDPVSLSVPPKPLVKMLNGDYGKNTVLNLDIEGEGSPRMVIIKDFQLHSWKRTLTHIDLWEISEDTTLHLQVPFNKVGTIGVEREGLEAWVTRSSLKIRCTASNIPASIDYDMVNLAADATGLRISELPMPEGVEAMFKHDYNLLRVKKARKLMAELELAAEEAEAAAEAAESAEGAEGEASGDGGADSEGGE